MLPPATLFAVGFLLCPFPALVPSGRNLAALLPELCDLLGSLYSHLRDDLVLPLTAAVTTYHRRRRRWRSLR
uniref:Secreted protein n=1 Tax=Hordeum vulgare subsp. vulgare TaxID=112509 RepID=A0A8I6XJZ0_HORVV